MKKPNPPFGAPINSGGAPTNEWVAFFNLLTLAATAWQPPSFANADAPNNTIYYSTTANKLVYKTSAGVVNNLY